MYAVRWSEARQPCYFCQQGAQGNISILLCCGFVIFF